MSETGATSSESGAVDGSTTAADRQPQEEVESCGECQTPSPWETCPTTFEIIAPVRVLCIGGMDVELIASDLPGFAGGTFTWTTLSQNLHLSNDRGRSIRVTGMGVSAGRDADVVLVIRTAPGCGPVVNTVPLTVVKVTFSKSALNKYGYDDRDGQPRWLSGDVPFHYLSIKEEDSSFVQVNIEGGLLGTDFDFECASSAGGRCKPGSPQDKAVFDLELKAGKAQPAQVLLALCKASPDTAFAQIGICVYPEKLVNVVVGRFEHPQPDPKGQAKGNKIQHPSMDFVGETPKYNDALREAVVKYKVFNLFTDGSIAPYEFRSGRGTFIYDIAASGGPDREGLQRIMIGKDKIAGKTQTPNTAAMVRVAIVPRMRSFYYLSRPAKRQDTKVYVRGPSVYFILGNIPPLGQGTKQEPLYFQSQRMVKTVETHWFRPDTVTYECEISCSWLQHDHEVGEFIEFFAAAWANDPIIIQEGTSVKDIILWTMPHEVSHVVFGLKDIDDTTNIMNHEQGPGQTRLRYHPRKWHYKPDRVENQWQQIHYPVKDPHEHK